MVFREVSVIEVREVLRAWLAGRSERAVAAQAGVDRKTSKRYVTAAVAAGLSREGGEEQLSDELVGQVVSVVRPVRRDGHGQGWAELEARREQIAGWADGGVPGGEDRDLAGPPRRGGGGADAAPVCGRAAPSIMSAAGSTTYLA
jgi:hypothetical protein